MIVIKGFNECFLATSVAIYHKLSYPNYTHKKKKKSMLQSAKIKFGNSLE